LVEDVLSVVRQRGSVSKKTPVRVDRENGWRKQKRCRCLDPIRGKGKEGGPGIPTGGKNDN